MTNRIHPDAHDMQTPDDGPEAQALDRLIAEAARDYHRPPAAVPREAMWEAIMAARTPQTGAPQTGAPQAAVPQAAAPVVVSLDAARARRAAGTAARPAAPLALRTGWSLAAAASLLLAAGVGMGRWWEGRTRAPGAPAGATVALTPDETRPATPVETRPTEPTLSGRLAQVEPARATTTSEPPADVAPAEGAGRGTRVIPPRAPRSGAPLRRDEGTLAYDVATVRHLTSVEALLVSYRADPLDSLADARVAAWARTLLQDTRLLLDSPAAASPVRRRLFEDLELVLVQMARLAPADSTTPNVRREREERALIDGTMRDARVLPRLRSAIPAGVGS